MRRTSVVCLLWAALAVAAHADQIVLRNGKVISGSITTETATRVSIQVTSTISMDVRRDRISRIVRQDTDPRHGLPQPNVVAMDGPPPEELGNRRKKVCFVQISGSIDSDLMVRAVARSCATAARQRASLVVFEIDTPGGRLDLMLELVALIEQLDPIPTVAYVGGGSSGGAYSAGAVLAMACGKTYMAPGTAIGAAAPVTVSGGRSVADEKYVSAIRAKMRSLAQKNGYPPKVAAAMVDAEIEIREAKVDGKLTFLSIAKAPAEPEEKQEPKVELGDWITTKGKLLTLTAVEAERYQIAIQLVGSRAELIAHLGLTGCQVMDLQTDDALAASIKRRQRYLVDLDGKITALEARARALDPRGFKYPRHRTKHGIYVPGDFLDDGRLWRQRSATCVKAVDACLEACREKLVLARKYPEMGLATKPVEAKMAALVTLRERVASEYRFRGSEK